MTAVALLVRNPLTTSGNPPTTVTDRHQIGRIQELTAMLLYEILARARMHEDQCRARERRMAHRLATAARWRRLARYAEQRAHRVLSGL